MKAMIYNQYGPPEGLHLAEMDQPALRDDELRVKVQAASLNWLDWHFLTGTPFLARLMAGGILRPKGGILGVDLAGTVEAVGANTIGFSPGDPVFGSTGGGCFAEYVCVRQDQVVSKPDGLTFVEAASVGAAASTALQALRDIGRIAAGQRVLINGASGGVGTFAVQIAKSYAAHVTGVCSAGNLNLVRSIGADEIIDYGSEDFTHSATRYDLIFDVVAKRSYAQCKHLLTDGGIFVTTAFSPGLAAQGLWTSLVGSTSVAPLQPKPPSLSDLAFLQELLSSRKVRPVIGRCYPLHELPDALRYLEGGHAKGKVVITM